MTIESNVCGCKNCVGAQCTCGCQNSVTMSAASCQCGEVFNCGPTCTCTGDQRANAQQVERH
jgi:hypothetical protein